MSSEILAVIVTAGLAWASWVTLKIIAMMNAKDEIHKLEQTIKALTTAMGNLTERLNLFTTSEINQLKAIGEGIEEVFHNLSKKREDSDR